MVTIKRNRFKLMRDCYRETIRLELIQPCKTIDFYFNILGLLLFVFETCKKHNNKTQV